MNRWKKILLVLTGSLVLIFGLAAAGAWFFEEDVKNLIIKNINSNLNTPVKVNDVQFSFISKFPSATLEFTDVVIDGKGFKESGRSLLRAHKLNLNFSLWEVFGSNISLRKVELSDADVFIYVSSTGEENYDIWKHEEKKTQDEFRLALKEVQLSDVHINYLDKAINQDYSAKVKSGTLAGDFGADEYDLKVKSDMNLEYFIAEKVNYLKEKEVAFDISLHVNLKRDLYSFNDSKIKIGNLALKTTGSVLHADASNKLDLTIQSQNAGLRELLSLLPGIDKEEYKKYEFDGKVNFTASINGVASKFKTPLVKIDFSSANTSIRPNSSELAMEKVKFNGYYTNRFSASQPLSYLSFSKFSALLDNQSVAGNIVISNLSEPRVSGNMIGNVNLKTLSAFYLPDTIEGMSGNAKINLQFEGQTGEIKGYKSTGTIDLQHVSFSFKQKAVVFEEFNGFFTFSGNQFNINELNGQAAGSDFKVKGSIDNFFSFIFQKNQVMKGNFHLTSRNLDLNELLEDRKKTTANDTVYKLDINKNFNVQIVMNVGVISFQKFQAWNLKGNIGVNNKVLSTENLSFKSMDGDFLLAGSINAQQQKNILISCNARVRKIDINQLFYETGNFGQDIIKSNNVRGILTADVKFSGEWTKSLDCDVDKINAQSTFTIEQGELLKFEPMRALSKYLKGADLENIKFSSLTNTISISKQKIVIPAMEIKSSAMEIVASGTHTFDNQVDYRLQLLLSQVTGKKVKEQNTEFGRIEDDGLGRTKIFLTMKGPMANPKIKYDPKGVEEKIVNDLKKENQSLKKILNKEFGWFKKDSSIVPEQKVKNKKEELQIEREESEEQN